MVVLGEQWNRKGQVKRGGEGVNGATSDTGGHEVYHHMHMKLYTVFKRFPAVYSSMELMQNGI